MSMRHVSSYQETPRDCVGGIPPTQLGGLSCDETDAALRTEKAPACERTVRRGMMTTGSITEVR